MIDDYYSFWFYLFKQKILTKQDTNLKKKKKIVSLTLNLNSVQQNLWYIMVNMSGNIYLRCETINKVPEQ